MLYLYIIINQTINVTLYQENLNNNKLFMLVLFMFVFNIYYVDIYWIFFCFSRIWQIFPVGAVFTGMDIMIYSSPIFWALLIFSVFVVLGLDLAILSLVFIVFL